MILRKDEADILQLLITSQDYISTYDIATSTGITRRMVRIRIASVKAILENFGYHLISKPSKGYLIENKTLDVMNTIQSLIFKSNKERETLFPTLPSERQTYIQKRLIEYNDFIKMEILADELLVSRSTIANDIIQLKKDLKKYQLTIIHKPNYGLYIDGPELGKRKALSDTIFTNLETSNMFNDFIDTFTSTSDYQIIEIIKNYNIEISDIGLIDFLLTLSISISRCLQGHQINTPVKDFEQFLERSEYNASLKIAKYIQETFSLILNDYEIQNIAILLICKRSTKNLKYTECKQTRIILQHIIKYIQEKTLISFTDKTFLENLYLYIESALLRQKYNEKIRTPIYEDIKLAYPLAYQLSLMASKIMEEQTSQSLSRSELASFSILFNNALRAQYKPKKKALLINSLGLSYEKYFKFMIESNFHNQLTINKITQYYKINDQDLSQYDLIITTTPIQKTIPIPCIHITYMINQDDINKIKSYLSYLYNYVNWLLYFHPLLFNTHVNIKTKKGLISSLYKTLKKVYPHLNETFKNEVLNENICSIKILNHKIALIKLDKPISHYDCITLHVLESPIQWDNDSFQFVVLFSCADNDCCIHNHFYSLFYKISQDEIVLSQLLSHLSYTDTIQLITQYENNKSTPPIYFEAFHKLIPLSKYL